MAKTLISDIIVPSVFAPYALERTTTLSSVIQSGIAGLDPFFDSLASGPGKTVDMPFWKDLTGASEVLSDSSPLSPENISTGQDTAAVHNRGKAWAANALVKYLAGDDPMRQIADLFTGFWARDLQTMLLKTLEGLFDDTAGVLRASHRLDLFQDLAAGSVTDAMRLTGDTFVDATVKLGDAGQNLVAVAMHSDVEGFLRKRDLIVALPDSEGKPLIRSFQGRRVVVDDGCPKVAGANASAYTTYLFGPGAFGLGNGTLEPTDAVEVGRDVLASDDLVVNRRRFILHPRGVRWIGTPAGVSPTNTELATAANWSKVYADKNIRVVAIRHNL